MTAACPERPARPARCAIRRRRRYVAQIDGIERRDIDAKLHGRRAEESGRKLVRLSTALSSAAFYGKVLLVFLFVSETPLAPFALSLRHLGRMFTTFETPKTAPPLLDRRQCYDRDRGSSDFLAPCRRMASPGMIRTADGDKRQPCKSASMSTRDTRPSRASSSIRPVKTVR
jgi:hypothetical protein